MHMIVVRVALMSDEEKRGVLMSGCTNLVFKDCGVLKLFVYS